MAANQCKEECDSDTEHCYLGLNDGSDCVLGIEVFPPEEGYQCCRVKNNSEFISTANSIMFFANVVADFGTQQARRALEHLLDSEEMEIPPGTTSHFTNGILHLHRINDRGMANDLMNLLDKIVPTGDYAVRATNADIISAQPELRVRKPNIIYEIRPRLETDLPNDIFRLSTNLSISIDNLSRARLEVWIGNALQWRQYRAHKADIDVFVRFPLETKLDRRFFQRMRDDLASSRFRGTISVYFATGDALGDDVVRGTVLSPNALSVTYTLLQDPDKLEIKIKPKS